MSSGLKGEGRVRQKQVVSTKIRNVEELFKKKHPVIPAAWQQHPLPHITRRHCLIRHWLFAAKFMSSFRVPNRVLQAVTTNYWELAQEVKPVCLLCSGDPLRPEHRLCVGVVGNERLASMPPRTRR